MTLQQSTQGIALVTIDIIRTARELANMTVDRRKDAARWEHEFLLLVDFLAIT